MQTQTLLAWLSPILVPLFRFGDPYRLLLQAARLVSGRMSPGVDFRLLRWKSPSVEERKRSGSVWARYPGMREGHVPAWDFSLQPGMEMMAAPRIFGLPPFASLVLVSDARAAESVPWNAACRQRGDSFVVDGVTHGKVAAFERFLESAGYDPVEVGAADMPVIVIDRDYRCPRRARVVLQAGCAYGAPGYIARLAWRLARLEARNFLQLAHAELDGPADGAQAEIEDLRRRYLEAVTERIRVVYFPADRSVEIHGRHVCRGVPALLLRECVRVAQNEGRTSFSYRELKRLPALVSHPKNTGFETRLGRLRAALAAADCGLTIEPERPGRFRLVSKGGLELEERSR